MLKGKLQADQLTALKSGQREKLETLRYILAQIQNKEIEKQKELTEEDIILLLRKLSKELHDTIVSFEKGGRVDLVEKNKNQIGLVDKYLPSEISDGELTAAVGKIIDESKELVEKNPKAIIGIAVSKLKDKTDPSRIVQIVNKLLTL